METPKTPLAVALRAVVLVGAALFVSAAIAGVAHYEKGVRDKANAVRDEQFREAEAIQEQQSREVLVKEREAQKQEEQEQEAHRLQMEAATIQLEREKGLCGRSGCVTITVLQAQQVSITHTDGNGYRHTSRNRLQRLTVAVDEDKTGRGIMIEGRFYDGAGASADLLCLVNCFDLNEGTTHNMGIDWLLVNDVRLPYLSIGDAKWQILELCPDSARQRCTEMSTPYTGD